MDSQKMDLTTKICPYVVMEIIREVFKMKQGESRRFVVCDPLAIKSVPEELEDYDDFFIKIQDHKDGWEIFVKRV